MPRITLNPVDHGPPASTSALGLKLASMLVSTVASAGLVYLLFTFAAEEKPANWEHDPASVRTNFAPLYTTQEIKDRFDKKRKDWEAKNPLHLPDLGGDVPPGNKPASNDTELPFGNEEPDLPPPDFTGSGGTNPRDVDRQNTERELQLAETLKKSPVFKLVDETQNFVETVTFEDGSREKCMNEFTAFKGRQAPVNEQLALQVLRKLPPPDSPGYRAHLDRIEPAGWFYGKSAEAADVYRGRGFSAEGRLFDLYEVKADPPIVLHDGTRVTSYYEGVVALLGPGLGRGENKIEQRTVMFQALAVPEPLKAYVGGDAISHEDKLALENVMVSLTGAYLRRWVYSRQVKPFSSEAKRVVSQDHPPLLLTADVALSDMQAYELTDELLQQVRDSLREDPAYLETEAAYFAMLARANTPDDEIAIVPEIGYFDLAGEETGPRYRGQGVHVYGLVGDDYVPVILSPNISGLRRVFRTMVLDDTSNLETPKRYLVDMIEPPTGLEPRAIIDIDARYYRNVFETESTTSAVRPLLIVRRIKGIKEERGDGWIYGVAGGSGMFLIMFVLVWFILAERRERARFEASNMEQTRKRLEKKGALKLKPLPGSEPAPPPSDKQ